MGRFIQFHAIVSYGPSNLNRDDAGRPKTCVIGGVERLRISSQSMKRAWRMSAVFRDHVGVEPGMRLKQGSMKLLIGERLRDSGVSEEKIAEVVSQFGNIFEAEPKKAAPGKGRGKKVQAVAVADDDVVSEADATDVDDDSPAAKEKKENLTFASAAEIESIVSIAHRIAAGEEIDQKEIRDQVGQVSGSVDISMFGRMLAGRPEYNVGAAVQVAHAVTTHKALVESDYFSGVDEYKHARNLSGAGHIDTAEFGAGVFYVYFCIDVGQLVSNLGGNTELAARSVEAIVRTAAVISPTGKQNSFASHARPIAIIAETGSQQPRNLACAFTDPVSGGSQSEGSVKALEKMLEGMDAVYGPCSDQRMILDVLGVAKGGGATLEEIASFCSAYVSS